MTSPATPTTVPMMIEFVEEEGEGDALLGVEDETELAPMDARSDWGLKRFGRDEVRFDVATDASAGDTPGGKEMDTSATIEPGE